MEILVNEDHNLLYGDGYIAKGTLVYSDGTPFIRLLTQIAYDEDKSLTLDELSLRWEIDGSYRIICVRGDKIWRGNYCPRPASSSPYEWDMTKGEQDFVCRHRPDLIGKLKGLHPSLKVKYQHEVELAKVDA